MVDEIIPIRKKLISVPPSVAEVTTPKNFLAPAPAITGPESIKAKRAASSLFRFRNSPAEIVEPERETPGIKAID